MAFDWFRRTFLNRSDKAAEPSVESPAETLSAAAAEPPAAPSSDSSDLEDATTSEVADVDIEPETKAEDSTLSPVGAETEAVDKPAVEHQPDPAEPAPVSDSILRYAQTAYENIQRQAEQAEVLTQSEPELGQPEVIDEVINEGEDEVEDVGTLEDEPEAELDDQLTSESIPAQAQDRDAAPDAAVDSDPALLEGTSPNLEDPNQTDTVIPAFDEGFIWSAEVLARQGRKAEEISVEEINWLQKLRRGLAKTRLNITNRLKAIVGQGPLNQDAVQEIETLLLQADVGVEATDYIIEQLQQKLRSEVLPPDAAIAYLKELLCAMLDQVQSDRFMPSKGVLNIWLMTGVNGAGKTTTIGKIAHVAQKSGYPCMIAAADTFRAAAVEQVRVWGQRSNVEVICNPGKNTDPAAVVFDGITAAQSRGIELLLVDTAGRLQNKKNLMDELSKIRRIVDKKAPDARVESFLVLDATLGQNGLQQAKIFSESAQLTGVVLTKLDGTAKGGVALGVVRQLGLPIRFIGAGEGIEDLRPFSSYEFVEALLSS